MILKFGSQQPSKKQVAKKSKNKETAATVVALYTGFPEERIKKDFHYLNYMQQAILLSRYGPPHPVKTTLNNQRKIRELSNIWFRFWKFLISDHHQFVPNKGDKKALPWQPQQPLISQTFRTILPDSISRYSRCPTTTSMNGNLNHNSGKKKIKQSLSLQTIVQCHR